MADRKPPGASWMSHVERQIARAEAEGAFENLKGAGKPIPDLGVSRDMDWWLRQFLKREGLSVAPAALSLRADVEHTLAETARMEFESEVRHAVRRLNERIRDANRTTTSGPASDVAQLDEDAFVRRWRERRQRG